MLTPAGGPVVRSLTHRIRRRINCESLGSL